MNPNQATGGLNIDAMLQGLEKTETPPVDNKTSESVSVDVPLSPSIPSETESVVVSSIESVVQPSFSVETIQKPIAPAQPASASSSLSPKKKFVMPAWMRVGASAFSTVLVLIIGGWVMSVQYPEETNTLLNGITGTFSSLVGVTKNNMKPDGIVVGEVDESETHGVADDISYDLPSPLADAMDQANNTVIEDNQAEQLFDTVFSGTDTNNTIDFSTGTSGTPGLTNSGTQTSAGIPVSTYDPNFNLPSTSDLPSSTEFKTQLLELSEQAQTSMTNLIGNNDVKLAKMRVVYKNAQAMLEEFATNDSVTQEKIDQYNEIKALYASVAQ